jgi:uncharacterized protein YraI
LIAVLRPVRPDTRRVVMKATLARLAFSSICAAALVAAWAQIAQAVPTRVAANVNLRQGPGTNFGIVTTIPRGATVEVMNCNGEWCNVLWQGLAGFAIARNLALASGAPVQVAAAPAPVVVAPPPAVVVAPAPVVVAPYWGPRVYYGPRWGWRRW